MVLERGHSLDKDIFLPSPSNFKSLQIYFSKFKALVLQLQQCDIEKKDGQLILAILSKLGIDYSMFLSNFHATKLIVQN